MTLTFYKDTKRQWRWRLVAGNGRILANSGEGYQRRVDCLNIALKLFDHLKPHVDGLE